MEIQETDRVIVKGSVERETEKAILYRTTASLGGGHHAWEVSVWLPKSQALAVAEGMEIPVWLLDAKERDLSRPHATARITAYARDEQGNLHVVF